MSSSDEAKHHFRVFAVNMVLAGTPASQVGGYAGVTKAAVTGWVKTADEIGFEALRTKSCPGRPKKLSAEQYDEIDAALKKDPKDSGYKVWDGPSLSDFIKVRYGIDLCVRQCQRIMHSLVYSLIRPQTYPSKGYEETEEREDYKKTQRNNGIRGFDPRLSRQGSFPSSIHNHTWMIQKRERAKGKIIPGKSQSIL